MKYMTDIHALNLPCALGTTGDWHTSALQWTKPRMLESDGSILGDFGIEVNSKTRVPEHDGETFNIANHVRACLDMIMQGRFTVAQGMNGDFIDDEYLEPIIFEKVMLFKELDNWEDIKNFMNREYGEKWLLWCQENHQSLD